MRWNSYRFVLLFALVVLPSVPAIAQEKSGLDAFRKLHAELREKMAEDLVVATTFLESRIEASP